MNGITRKSLFSRLTGITGEKTKFSEIQREYEKFKKKAEKSDMAGSITLAEKEIEILSRLIAAAEQEGKTDNIKDLQSRLEELQKTAAEKKPAEPIFYQPVFHHSVQIQATQSETDAAEVDETENAEETEETDSADEPEENLTEDEQRIKSAFEEEDNYHISCLLKKCRNESGSISPSILSAVERMAETKTDVNTIINFLEEFSVQDKEGAKSVDLALCDEFNQFRNSGFDSVDSLGMLHFINNGNFLEPDVVKDGIIKMNKVDIPAHAIRTLINIVSVNDTATDKVKVSSNALSNIRTVKSSMAYTRIKNYYGEKFGIINQKNETVYTDEDGTTYIFKKDEPVQIIPAPEEEKSVAELRAELDEILKEKEDNILVDFTKKYRTKDGEINANAMRAMTSLIRFGTTMDNLLELTDFSLDNGIVNIDKLNLISQLKSAGAMSKDIKEIISAIETDEQGKYSKEDIQNACDLTSVALGGKQVVSLLPDVRGNKDVKDFVMFIEKNEEAKKFADSLADTIKEQDNTAKLTLLMKKNDGTVDETALEMLNKLVEHFEKQDVSTITGKGFVDVAEVIINASKNPETGLTDEEAAGICAIMSQNDESFDNILNGINICKNKEGIINPDLAEILWQLSLDKSNFDDISTVINACKDNEGNVNQALAKTILAMFEAGDKSPKIIGIIKKQS